MNGSVNKVILLGYILGRPELQSLKNDQKVIITLVTEETIAKTDGPSKHNESHRVVLHNEMAERAIDNLRENTFVRVEGRIHTSGWMDQDSVKRYVTEIIAEKFEIFNQLHELLIS